MKISIQTKLLALCILLVLLTTTSISATYYILTKQDKHRESQQRIQVAFDIILDDFADQLNISLERLDKFLEKHPGLPLIIQSYNRDESQISSPQFITSFLISVVYKLKEFGPMISADQVVIYGANKRLLAIYHHNRDQETVGGYVVSESGNDAYLSFDDPSYVSTWLILDRKPIPDTPLPTGITAHYEGNVPESTSTSLFSKGQKFGMRISAPLYQDESIVGILVCDILYTQNIVERYASLSKTDVNLFAGNQLSVGTLRAQTEIDSNVMKYVVSCEDILTKGKGINVSSVTLASEDYYQGRCAFRNAQGMIGMITISLSQEIEKQEIRKILTAVFTISGGGIVICLVLISWLLVPRFTDPIIKLTNAALSMAKGEVHHDINTSGTDELGTLARSFVHMRDEIQKKSEELEQRVEERTAEITRQKYILDTFMENVPDPIYFKDRNSRIIRANKACAARFGLSDPAEEIGKTDFDFFPGDLARVRYEQEQEIVRTGQPLLTLEEPDVNKTWSLTTKMPLRDEHGKIIGTFGISRNITKQKQTEEALKHAKDAAEAANRAKSEFLANMSHELRTPLNVILGFTQIMARNMYIPDEERENLDIIRRSGEHLLTLINSVLDMSKIEAGHIVLQETNIDLFRLFDELENMFSLKAVQKQLSLTFERAAEIPRYICTDEIKLRQVLMNLLNNAVKFTEEGGVILRIANCELRIADHKSEIRNLKFEIEDTGPGIAPDEIASLFEAFRQTQTGQQAQEGTGLGLAISQKFIQMMGGDIAVRSEVGRGTTFSFAIPVQVVNATDVPMPLSRRRVIALEPGQPRYQILIVDDEPDSRRLLVKLLTPLGFDVREASNGQEAIAIWEEFAPHLIWMDMRMPVLDGYEATKTIRELEIGNSKLGIKDKEASTSPSEFQISNFKFQTIIIALTASGFENKQLMGISTGFDGVVRKPFREMEIFEIMHKHLGVRYVYEESQRSKVKTCPERSRKGQRSKVEDVLTPAALTALPEKLFTELQQAVNAADPKLVNQSIARLHEQNPLLADTLTELVKQFRFDILQALFEEKECLSYRQ